jgi:hypothetical protein
MESKFFDTAEKMNLVNREQYEELYAENLKFSTMMDEKKWLTEAIAHRREHLDGLYELYNKINEEQVGITIGSTFYDDELKLAIEYRAYTLHQQVVKHKLVLQYYLDCLNLIKD